MPVYFGLWKENRAIAPPADPALIIPVLEGFIAQMKSQLESGLLKEVHEFLGGGAGYRITGDHPKEKFAEVRATWSPLVLFELHETIKLPKPLEIGLAVAKQRAAAMKG